MELITEIITPVCPTEYFVNVDGLDDVDGLEDDLENDDDLDENDDDLDETDDEEDDDDEDEEI